MSMSVAGWVWVRPLGLDVSMVGGWAWVSKEEEKGESKQMGSWQ